MYELVSMKIAVTVFINYWVFNHYLKEISQQSSRLLILVVWVRSLLIAYLQRSCLDLKSIELRYRFMN